MREVVSPDGEFAQGWRVNQSSPSSTETTYVLDKSMPLKPYLQIVNSNKHKSFVPFLTSIATASSIISIIKPSKFVRVGSGAVESTVGQIDRRTKISGAQWKEDNVPQVLAQRQSLPSGTNLCLKNKNWDAPI